MLQGKFTAYAKALSLVIGNPVSLTHMELKEYLA